MTVLGDYSARVSQPELTASVRYDETVTPDGALRPGWKSLAEVAVRLTESDLRRVDDDIERMLADDGVTYSRAGGSAPEAWRLDPLPLVVESAEWTALEVGLTQRAELLNALLVDLYGEQRSLAAGVLPPAAVFAHPGFVRVAARGSSTDTTPLLLCATDLGRGSDGAWLALGDRAQAPSGIGYAMENRRVISRVLPDLYQEARLYRTGTFLGAMRSALIQSAYGDDQHARVVVLSPGSSSETAYDQSAVASSLGFPLVEGSDLVMRGGRIWLRAPGRLEPVDVILRRVDAAWSDSLELRGDSRLGVAGLCEAVRRGTVRVVNGLGSGVLENPALLPYLGELCHLLLGEELRIANQPTWWGGDPVGREVLLDRLGEASLLVRTLDGGSPLSEPDESVRAMVERAPYRFVGQERPHLSVAPSLDRSGSRRRVTASAVTLRTFTLRHGTGRAGAYRPMLGGLAEVLDESGTVTSSKDVWVLRSRTDDVEAGPAEPFTTPAPPSPAMILPRVLDDMFWLGRYTERAEAMLRVVLAAHGLAEEVRAESTSAGAVSLQVLMGVVGRLGGAPYAAHELDSDFRSILLDPRREGSVAQAVVAMRDSAQSVRDQLSGDIWRAFGAFDRAVTHLVESPYSNTVAEAAGRMLSAMLAVEGVTANMMRDPGWQMIGAGRALERALQLCHLLQATTTDRRGLDVDHRVHDAVLLSAESAVTHRRRYRGHVRPGNVLDLLLLDTANPRSLAFTLDRAAEHLAALPHSTGSSRPERLLADLRAVLAETDIATLVAIGGVDRPNLTAFLDHALESLARVADAIAELHFNVGPAPRPFAQLAGVGADALAGLAPHDLLLRRPGLRQPRHRLPDPADDVVAAGQRRDADHLADPR